MLNQLSYLLSLLIPTSTLLFLLQAPHENLTALVWTVSLFAVVIADFFSPSVKPEQDSLLPNRFYNIILYSLALLQIANITLMLVCITQLQWSNGALVVNSLINLLAIRFLVGTSSGLIGFVVAHELIHRSDWLMQIMGRLLLLTVCYPHFAIAHQQGHHRSVGGQDDIATANIGETFSAYWQRVVISHFRFAWRYEQQRLFAEHKAKGFLKLLRNRVLQGILCEVLLLALIVAVFGWLAAAMFLYQAVVAARLLEASNYFQHWGLSDEMLSRTLGWVNNSWITNRLLIGLSNHISHHQNGRVHFQATPYTAQGPVMPYGYFVMNFWVKLNNASYQRMAVLELKKYGRSLQENRERLG